MPYLHHNTDIVHHETVGSDPELYYSNFMADPAEYWYGEGFMKFISDLNDTGKWEAPNKKVAIVTGSQNYSVVIANAMRDSAEKYGWEISLYETVVWCRFPNGDRRCRRSATTRRRPSRSPTGCRRISRSS